MSKAIVTGLQQLVHGYRRGHEQLASSVRLSREDSELVTRLSDLSGSLSGSATFAPYVSAYPLPSGTYYAIARTWPDHEAPRSGCVLTHTLLVPSAEWALFDNPRSVEASFHKPTRESLESYRHSCEVAASQYMPPAPLPDRSAWSLVDFAWRFFGEGRRAIVWLDERLADELLWIVLRSLWPEIRSVFSACTYCLQPRSLTVRPFDLMFAPSGSRSRFLNLTPEQLVDERRQTGGIPKDHMARWRALAEMMVGRSGLAHALGMEDLWGVLDDDPTCMRRLLGLREVMESNAVDPLVAVGALDLVESLARDPAVAVGTKTRLARKAVDVVEATVAPRDALTSLILVQDRLRRPGFELIEGEVGPLIARSVARRATADVFDVVESLGQSEVAFEGGASWVARGFAEGLAELAKESPRSLLALGSAPDIARVVLRKNPVAAGIYASMALEEWQSGRGEQDAVLTWLISVRDTDIRTSVRRAVLPRLRNAPASFAEELLRELAPEEVGPLLEAMFTDPNQRPNVPLAVRIAEEGSKSARSWVIRALRNGVQVPEMVQAATYPLDHTGLGELLNDCTSGKWPDRRGILVALLQRCEGWRLPNWIEEAASVDPRLWVCLLSSGPGPSAPRGEQLVRLLAGVRDVPFADWPSVLLLIPALAEEPFFNELIRLAMRSVVPAQVARGDVDSHLAALTNHPVVEPWFVTVPTAELRNLVTWGTPSSEKAWSGAWQWLAGAPAGLYRRSPSPLPEVIESLLRARPQVWPPSASTWWAVLLERASEESRDRRVQVLLCVQALRFGLGHAQLPMSQVVSVAFRPVYQAVTESQAFTSETGPLFSILDWDRGKELRRQLADVFFRAGWPAIHLVEAAGDVRLLRKLFKRVVRRPGGERYLRSAVEIPTSKENQELQNLIRALRGMLDAPDFFEEWE